MKQRTFKDAYGVLQRHAETLRDQEEPNIDDLLTIVTESVEAYKVCKERIDAVEAALQAALDGVAVGAAPQVPAGREAGPSAKQTHAGSGRETSVPSPEADDDIPF